MFVDAYLRCCPAPQARMVLALVEEPHDHVRLLRCGCGAWWLDRLHERIDWSGGEDDLDTWIAALTAEEARAIQAAVDLGRPPALDFLRTRAALHIDTRRRVREVVGVPPP